MYSGIASFPMSCKQGRSFNCLDLRFVVNAHRSGKSDCQTLHAPNMSMGNLIFRVDRHRQRFDCRKV